MFKYSFSKKKLSLEVLHVHTAVNVLILQLKHFGLRVLRFQEFSKSSHTLNMMIYTHTFCTLLGLYDELSTFLSQLNLYRGKGLTVSHELALLLQLYNGSSWIRNTGMKLIHN